MGFVNFWRELWRLDKFLFLLVAAFFSMIVLGIGTIAYSIRHEAVEYKENEIKALAVLKEYGNTVKIVRIHPEHRTELSGKSMEHRFYVITYAQFRDGHQMIIRNRDIWFDHAIIPKEGESWQLGIYRCGSKAVINLYKRAR